MQLNEIHPTFKYGRRFKMGRFCVIEEDVIVGDNVELGHFVLLKEGTRIGDDCYIDSYVRSSGQNRIGRNVTLRFGATIARNVDIEDEVFISPNVVTVFSLPNGTRSPGITIGKRAFIGTGAVIGAAVTIGEGVVIGANSYVHRDCLEKGLYVGNPARKVR